jgi:hypothetical protein
MSEHPIEVRRPDLDLSDEIPRYWYGGKPFETHFLNALSSTFPDGEAFFVRSVMHYREQITDPELKQAIAGFAGQEGQHSRMHALHVQMMREQGYPGIERRNALERKILVWANKKMPKASIASTAALEHLTALLARQLLTRPEITTDPMDPRMARLWQWHALEEAEHKAVAFDVMAAAAPSYAHRVWAQANNTLGLLFEALERTTYMLRRDGLLFDRKVWASGLRWLFGRKGILSGLGRDYWAWYRRDFHPNDIDDTALIEEWQERVRQAA